MLYNRICNTQEENKTSQCIVILKGDIIIITVINFRGIFQKLIEDTNST